VVPRSENCQRFGIYNFICILFVVQNLWNLINVIYAHNCSIMLFEIRSGNPVLVEPTSNYSWMVKFSIFARLSTGIMG
jgi:hypothetical protein